MKVKFIQKTKGNEVYWLVERGWWLWKEYFAHTTWESSKFLSSDEIAWIQQSNTDVYYTTFKTLELAKEKVGEIIDKERAAKEKVLKRLKFDY